MRIGPIFIPKLSAAASIWCGILPFCSRNWLPDFPIVLLAMKPSQFPTGHVTFLSLFPNSIAVALVLWLDLEPRTFSRSFITFAGEKKWHPMTSSGLFVADAISSMFRNDVLLARTQPGL